MDQNVEFSTLIQDIIETSAGLLQRSKHKPENLQSWLEKIPHAFADLCLLSNYLVQNPSLATDQYHAYCQDAQNLLQTHAEIYQRLKIAMANRQSIEACYELLRESES
jgi:hypothetical protein